MNCIGIVEWDDQVRQEHWECKSDIDKIICMRDEIIAMSENKDVSSSQFHWLAETLECLNELLLATKIKMGV